MKAQQVFLSLSAIFLLGACHSTSTKQSLSDCPIVATQETIGDDIVTTLHPDRIKDTLDLPLSQLLENLRIVPLDNREEALTKGELVSVFEQHILIGGSIKEACKLFDHEGHYLCQIGANGQGPGEYWAVYDKQVDAANDRIYLLPWNAKSILVYDLKGNYLSSIPLPTLVPKGVFTADTQNRKVTIGMLPFDQIEGASVVWQQDFEGNVLHRVDAKPYAITPDYSNEVEQGHNLPDGTFDFSIFLWTATRDTLYHFLPEANRLAPVFTLRQPSEPLQHGYKELPNYFLTDITTATEQVAFGSQVSDRVCALVDKQTLKGAYVRFLNDLIGNIPVKSAFFYFQKGYFAYTMEPGDLLDYLDAALSHPDRFSTEERTRLENLRDEIDPNANNYLFVGKIKTDTNSLSFNDAQEAITIPEKKQVQPTKEQTQSASSEADTIWHMPYHTPAIKDYKTHLRDNNRYNDWKGERKVVIVNTIVEKDGSTNSHSILRKCGVPELEEEAIRLVKEADIEPGTDENGNPVRCRCVFVIEFPSRYK